MRTTLTIDDDVAARLEQLRKKRGTGLKDLVNEALRRGLRELEMRPKPRTPYRTRSVDLGRVRIASIDNIGEVLAIAEGEDFA
jgi:Ribbon-helix-helix protein, copG family